MTVGQSSDRYIGFLTIIDVASRQLLTHLIMNEDPPTQYIDQFLRQHGIQQTDSSKAIITTNNKGYLAKSKVFVSSVNLLKYRVRKINVNCYTDVTFYLIK